ncbi:MULTISPECIES: ABC transporter ATP-binding protein [unclassified Bradyrhizobium]|uniref:ABC transporter ATP-binding protein n=1 Tax=unclassified Bradyrhizobium TaxID=2631580 RepID=UPI002478529B|nr:MULTISPECIES: ABC transporter ATP-binding protein [unclassified Bradyrhizobium]WGS19746.1 ABC transporter ATP-binding protein [Bradyrhizobium sp. ISRA463]WGS26590.1 ABC transporter ATP-binding protein [Bradyrhizobium sp. ISRA464]
MAVLEVRGLTKHFGDFKALKGIDLTTREGEFLTIVGPSGCGKTTLMRSIAGLEKPTAGDVFLNGRPITQLPPRARNIAMVFQSYALYPHMSAADNIAFPLKARGVARAEQERLIRWAAGILGIESLLHRRPARLSGGEKQKVALARAIVRKPSLFIFDEPLSSLDAQVRALARAELRQLHDRTGVTTVYVTHDQVEAVGLGDRVAVMQAGALRQIGSPQELYAEPANTFVAGFIGTPPMNLLEHGAAIVGFRPEHLTPRAAVPESEDVATFQVHVARIEFLGSEWLAYGSADGEFKNAKVLCKLRQETIGKVKVGEVQEFVVSRSLLRFFDIQTGIRTATAPI